MTTPQYPDPNQPPDPNAYQPPDPSAYQPPSGAYPPSGGQPQADQPGGYPPPDASGGYPPPDASGGYPPPDPGAYPPPGQPGATYPPPPGTPGAPGMPGAPGEQPKKSNTSRIIMAVVIVAVVVLGIVLYFVNRGSDPDYAKVGDCIQYSSDTDVDVVDCTSSDAEYKVVKRVDGTNDKTACDGSADTDVTLYTKPGNDKQYTLCVRLVLKEGQCFESSSVDKLSCSDSKADGKVIKELDGTTDKSGCPADTQPRVYKADNQVLCLGPNS